MALLASSLMFAVPSHAAIYTSPAESAAAPVSAEGDAVKESGFYIEGNAGYGAYKESKEQKARIKELTNQGYKVTDKGLAANANLGYKINKNLAIEAGYTYLPEMKSANSVGNIKQSGNYAIHGAVKGIIPFENGFNVFAKVGVASLHPGTITETIGNVSVKNPSNEKKKNLTELYAGAGVGYAISENVEANVQYVTFGNKAHAAMAGISYIF